jgi:hypothetical protein
MLTQQHIKNAILLLYLLLTTHKRHVQYNAYTHDINHGGRQRIVVHHKLVLKCIHGESCLHASHREDISQGIYLRLLTGRRANGHLTPDLSGTGGVGFHTLRHQRKSPTKCLVGLLAFGSLGLPRTTTFFAHKEFVKDIIYMQTTCVKHIKAISNI